MNMKLRNILGVSAVLTTLVGVPTAQASSVTAAADFLGITDIRSDGTADIIFTGFDYFEAAGLTTDGIADFANDAMLFDSEVSSYGEGTATNGGSADFISSSSYAAASDYAMSDAFTFIDSEILLSGTGLVEIDLAYDLFADVFDTNPDGFATAGIFAFTGYSDEESAEIDLLGTPGPGASVTESAVLTLSFFVDVDSEAEPISDYLTVGTFASAQASPVPLPAAGWLLLSALIGLGGAARKRRG